MSENIVSPSLTPEMSVCTKCEGTIGSFFFSSLVEDFVRFSLLGFTAPESVPLWMVPLLVCTSSIKAAIKKTGEINQEKNCNRHFGINYIVLSIYLFC